MSRSSGKLSIQTQEYLETMVLRSLLGVFDAVSLHLPSFSSYLFIFSLRCQGTRFLPPQPSLLQEVLKECLLYSSCPAAPESPEVDAVGCR